MVRSRAKLDYKLNYLVCRGEKELRIYIPEISVLIVESTAVSLTAALLSELIKNKVKVIFCDEKHLPHSQLVGFYDNYHSPKQVSEQIRWDADTKARVWQKIVTFKIDNQRQLLKKYGYKESELLEEYQNAVALNDSTNREGHAAKVYFNVLFEQKGRRVPTHFNAALNYGYAILLSAFCREITASGYLTQLGIWHINEFNHYNLASDLMEPFRVIADDLVLSQGDELGNFKNVMANILNAKITLNNKSVYLDNAIEIFIRNAVNVLNGGDISQMSNFYTYELPIYENNSNV